MYLCIRVYFVNDPALLNKYILLLLLLLLLLYYIIIFTVNNTNNRNQAGVHVFMTITALQYLLKRTTNPEVNTQFIRNLPHIVFPHISHAFLYCMSTQCMHSPHKMHRRPHDEFVFDAPPGNSARLPTEQYR